MLDKKAKLKGIRDLGRGNYLLTLSSPEQARLVHPGQFVMLKCAPGIEESPLLRRPLSVFDIHRHPRTERPSGLDLLVKDVGPGTHRLVGLARGTEIAILGPQGRGFQSPPEMHNRVYVACLVAGGVGIAALYLLARSLISHDVKPVLFYGARNAADLVLRESFAALGIETHYATEDGTLGERGLVTAPLASFLEQRSRVGLRVYACGPWAMMKATHELAARHQVICEVSLEARMGCALGACLGCVVQGRDENGEERFLRVCQEGPVMDSRVVDWDRPPM